MSFKPSDFMEERPFNMAAALLKRADLLFLKANEASVLSEYGIWYGCLMALKRTASFKFEDSEKAKIKEMLDGIRTSLTVNSNTNDLAKQYDLAEKLDECESKIIELMYKYELYYPKYSKKEWQNEADKEEDV